MLVNSTVVKGAYFCGHHLNCPEGCSLNITATGTGFVVELTFIAFESAGAKYHGIVILMQDTQNPVVQEKQMQRIIIVYEM